MPTYQYACTECRHALEVVQSFTDEPLTECPECSGRLRKVFNSVGIVFKGSGFYRTDSRDKPAASSDKPGDKSDKSADKGKPEGPSSAGGDTKADKGVSGAGKTPAPDKSGSSAGSSTAGSAA